VGSKSKPNFGGLYPDPPAYSLLPGSLDKYQGQIQSLVDLFGRRADGTDQFDYMKFLYGPQETQVNSLFGINRAPGDQTPGALQRTNAGLNQRGLLDTGTSGVIQAQLEASRANQLANLFGQSKILQRGDIDEAIAALGQLYPAQFTTNQIQPNINYQNAIEKFNQDFRRNSAQQSYEASKPGNPWASIIGSTVGSLFGPAGASIGGSIGQQFSGGGWAQPQGGGGGGLSGLLGGLNLGGLFGGGGSQQSFQMPGQNYASQSNMFSNNGANYLATKYPSLFGAPGF
jgi:hypothetical protein